jgi:hypothetical protein
MVMPEERKSSRLVYVDFNCGTFGIDRPAVAWAMYGEMNRKNISSSCSFWLGAVFFDCLIIRLLLALTKRMLKR